MKRPEAALREELYDTEDEQAVPGRLGYYLRLCHEELWPEFQRRDASALSAQKSHRNLTRVIATCGGLALALGSVRLALPRLIESAPRGPWRFVEIVTTIGEFLAVIAALGVLVGLFRKGHRSWLLARYQAERLRLLKFRAFADPRVWCASGDSLEWENRFRAELVEIHDIENEDLDSISHHEPIPVLPDPAVAESVPAAVRRELVVYYRVKRLEPQTAYFRRKSEHLRMFDNPIILPVVFFGSVAAVLGHLLADYVSGPSSSSLSVWLTIASLVAPAAWAAVRTFKSANEFARNRSRSIAKEHALEEIAKRLREDPQPHAFFGEIMLAEYILAADQHEWLRLMVEAEWYG